MVVTIQRTMDKKYAAMYDMIRKSVYINAAWHDNRTCHIE